MHENTQTMIQSMTGFGKAGCDLFGKKLFIEIKSVNSKQFDLSIRMPQALRAHEMDVRNLLAKTIERGKVDCLIYFDQANKESTVELNVDGFERYINQLKEASEKLGIQMPSDMWSILLRMPDAFHVENNEVDEVSWEAIQKSLDEAMTNFSNFRIQEGTMLESIFLEKIASIDSLLKQIEPYENERVERIKARLKENLDKIEGHEFDHNRLEQELIYYIEKLDINEEKSRLSNHLSYFKETLRESHGQGKKLGFIAQEIGREINTMGSKSNHSGMQKLVVCMKDELEQIKEQVLNVL